MAGRIDETLIAEIKARIWHHRIDFGNGIVSDSHRSPANKVDRMQLDDRIPGSVVLDVGTRDGGLAFEFEKRGAMRVVANDLHAPDHFNFELARESLGSKVAFLQANLSALPFFNLPRFDIVNFSGVLYHTSDPYLALMAMRELCKPDGTLIVESAIEIAQPLASHSAFGYQESGKPNSWLPTDAGLEGLCADAGLLPVSRSSWADRKLLTCSIKGRPRFPTFYRTRPVDSLLRSIEPSFQ